MKSNTFSIDSIKKEQYNGYILNIIKAVAHKERLLSFKSIPGLNFW
ncbi:Uncharacterised protein [Elizabethkingia meningoseptica]|nr:Uncharacterised protein [Elizabethkingia meningoseptica]